MLNSNSQSLLAWCNPKALLSIENSTAIAQKESLSIRFANKNLFSQKNAPHPFFVIEHDCPWCLGQGTQHPGVASLPLLPQIYISKRCFGIDYADIALVDSLLGWFASLSHPPPAFFF